MRPWKNMDIKPSKKELIGQMSSFLSTFMKHSDSRLLPDDDCSSCNHTGTG